MDITLEQIKAFVAAADAGSFSAASRKLEKAQSAVSTQIANLEVELGLTLFDRSSRNPVLTEAGRRLVGEARILLDRREHFVGVATNLERGVETRLVVAIDELYPEHVLAALFERFSQHFPTVELEVLFPMMQDVGRLVQNGSADIGVMWRQEVLPVELGFRAIGTIPLRLVCGRDHPLAATVVDWEDLKRYRQILLASRSEKTDKQSLRVAAEVWWVESHWVILQMVRRGIGWAFVSEHVINGSPVLADLVLPDLRFDHAGIPVVLELIWHKQRRAGPAAVWLRDELATTRLDGTR